MKEANLNVSYKELEFVIDSLSVDESNYIIKNITCGNKNDYNIFKSQYNYIEKYRKKFQDYEIIVLDTKNDNTIDIFVIKNKLFEETSIIKFNNISFEVPSEIKSELEDVIEKSKYILDLEYGWDEDDGETFEAETYNTMIEFLLNYAIEVYKFNKIIKIPEIYPSYNGSIDIDFSDSNNYIDFTIFKNGTAIYSINIESKQDSGGTFNPKDFNINLLPIVI